MLGPVHGTVDIQKPVPAAPQPSNLPAAPRLCECILAMVSSPKAVGSWDQAEWKWLIIVRFIAAKW